MHTIVRVIETDRAAGTAKYSDTVVLQYHINPPGHRPMPTMPPGRHT